jgi:hypothetical protein
MLLLATITPPLFPLQSLMIVSLDTQILYNMLICHDIHNFILPPSIHINAFGMSSHTVNHPTLTILLQF